MSINSIGPINTETHLTSLSKLLLGDSDLRNSPKQEVHPTDKIKVGDEKGNKWINYHRTSCKSRRPSVSPDNV